MTTTTVASAVCLVLSMCCSLSATPETIEFEYRCYKLTRNEMQRLAQPSSAIHSNKLQFFQTLTPVSTNRLAVRPGERFDHSMALDGKSLRFGGITGMPRDNTGQLIYGSTSGGNNSLYTFGNWWLYYDNSRKGAMTGAAFVDKHQMFFKVSNYQRLFLIVVPRLNRQGMRTTESTPTK
jgi:hypothetical protein